VDVIKNNQFIYTANPGKRTVEFRYQDTKLDSGVSYYYVRAQQKDGQIAWSSPIWINYK
jgi:hypothetical protein